MAGMHYRCVRVQAQAILLIVRTDVSQPPVQCTQLCRTYSLNRPGVISITEPASYETLGDRTYEKRYLSPYDHTTIRFTSCPSLNELLQSALSTAL